MPRERAEEILRQEVESARQANLAMGEKEKIAIESIATMIEGGESMGRLAEALDSLPRPMATKLWHEVFGPHQDEFWREAQPIRDENEWRLFAMDLLSVHEQVAQLMGLERGALLINLSGGDAAFIRKAVASLQPQSHEKVLSVITVDANPDLLLPAQETLRSLGEHLDYSRAMAADIHNVSPALHSEMACLPQRPTKIELISLFGLYYPYFMVGDLVENLTDVAAEFGSVQFTVLLLNPEFSGAYKREILEKEVFPNLARTEEGRAILTRGKVKIPVLQQHAQDITTELPRPDPQVLASKLEKRGFRVTRSQGVVEHKPSHHYMYQLITVSRSRNHVSH
jgi:hypothetical protein